MTRGCSTGKNQVARRVWWSGKNGYEHTPWSARTRCLGRSPPALPVIPCQLHSWYGIFQSWYGISRDPLLGSRPTWGAPPSGIIDPHHRQVLHAVQRSVSAFLPSTDRSTTQKVSGVQGVWRVIWGKIWWFLENNGDFFIEAEQSVWKCPRWVSKIQRIYTSS